jgi:hypothetical protein
VQQLKACFAQMKLSPIFDRQLVVVLIVHLLFKFRRLYEVNYYQENPITLRLIGLHRLPDVIIGCHAFGQIDAAGAEHVLQQFCCISTN